MHVLKPLDIIYLPKDQNFVLIKLVLVKVKLEYEKKIAMKDHICL